jgi:cell wall-associated NlpC family hydrolase
VVAAAVGALLPAGASSAAPQLSIAQVQARIDALNTAAEKITEAYDAARDQLGTIRREQAVAADELARDRAALAGLQRLIGAQANLVYRTGGLGDLGTLVSAGDPAALVDTSALLDQVSRDQAAQLQKVAAAHRAVDGATATLAAKASAAAHQLALIAADRTRIEGLLHQEKALLAGLRAADRARLAAAAAASAAAASAMRGSYHGPASGRAGVAVRFAYAQLGKPYVYGAAGPSSYDCSGLTMRAWGAAGVSLPHNAAGQQSVTRYVSYADLQPGDLVFFGSPAYHVGIYIGGGRMIAAPHTGDVVKIQSVSAHGGFSGGGRP